jgi:hypothetical protein
VVLEKDGNSLGGCVTNEEVLHKVKKERNIPHLIKKRKSSLDWSHIA